MENYTQESSAQIKTITFGFFKICISVRLSDRSLHREEQKKCRQKLPQSGLNPGPLDHHCAGLVCVGQKISEVSFVSCTTSHFGLWLFLESIEHDFIKVIKFQAGN